MRRLVVGVMGHVDHGKTALVRALTGQETDRLAEEQARGISIALGFAHLEVAPGVIVDFIDMPGHERFVRNMVAGATGIDIALLVVAANEGVRPQTIEHAEIAGLLGIGRAIVAVTKTDLADGGAAADTACKLLRGIGLESIAIPVSALHRSGLDDLKAELAAMARAPSAARDGGIAFLPVDRAFAVAGHGPVVTGTLRGAAIAQGDVLELLPERRPVRVRAVQVHGDGQDQAEPGQRVALNLRDVAVGDLARGMALAAPGALEPSEWLTISIRAVAGAMDLANGLRVRALMGTDEAEARLRLLDRDVLKAGEDGFAQLRFAAPVALPAGEHVILRAASPAVTVAGGRVLEPDTRRLRRHAPRTIERLRRLRDLPPDELIAGEIAERGVAGVHIRDLSRLTALREERIAAILRAGPPVVALRQGLVVARAAFDGLLARIPALLPSAREQLAAALPRVGEAVLDEALRRLLAAGTIAKHANLYLVPTPGDDRARAGREAEISAAFAERLRVAGLTPPTPKELPADPDSRRALDRLLKAGTLVRAVDRDKQKDMIFHRDAIAEAIARLEPLLAGEGLLVTDIAAALGISRKFVMPLLDHLDRTRFTRRVGDRRVLHASRER